MSGILYLKESAGVVAISLCRVKGAKMLRFVCGEQIEEYDLAGGGLPNINPGRQEGDPVITLQTEKRENYPLANWPGAVAVTVTDRFYWLENGRWCRKPNENNGTARSFVEKECFRDGYDLPD